MSEIVHDSYGDPLGRAPGDEQSDEDLDRESEARELMVRDYDHQRVLIALRKKWGVSTSTVRRVMGQVRRRWAIEAEKDVNKHAARAEVRQQTREVVYMAMNQKKALYDRDGVLVDLVDDPNLNAATNALKLRCQLDGLLEDNGAPDFTWLRKAVEGAPRTEEEARVLMDELSEPEEG